jgi:hypothetical protein
MYKQKLAPPYKIVKGVKKTTFNIRNKGGVYLIYDLDNVLKYIGMSSNNLYRTMYHHFQSWNDYKNYYPQKRVLYDPDKVKVRIAYINSISKIEKLEKALIFKHRDKVALDNPNQYRNFDADEKEKKVLTEYIQTETKPVAQFKGDIPF